MSTSDKNIHLQNIIDQNDFILMEGSIIERLRRSKEIELHPTLVNAPLIYDKAGRVLMAQIYDSYIDIAQQYDTDIFLCTPTWRTNYTRVNDSEYGHQIIYDAVEFLKELRQKRTDLAKRIKISGLVGCKNDCYKPHQALSIQQATEFHTWQINHLTNAGVDFLIAETLPQVDESIGIARAMAQTGLIYFISFVISRDGNVLDGTPLANAIEKVDQNTKRRPAGYMVNCAHPSFLCPGKQPKVVFDRLVGYMGNASSLNHCDLEGAETLQVDSISDWGDKMLELNSDYGIKILGGCCGTGVEHLRYICENQKTKTVDIKP